MKNLTETFAAIALGAAIAAPNAIAGGLTAEQLAEERENLWSQGSLPFVHSLVLNESGSRSSAAMTQEEIDEFENLRAQGSFPFIHSPNIYGSDADDHEVVWTEEQIEAWHNLHAS